MSASESQVKSVRECTAAVRSLSAHLARVALGRAARTPMPMMGAAATRPGRRAVEPMSFAALSSTAMAPERRAGRCERVPARPGLRAMGAGFELSRLPRTFEKVVARPPPTEESNLNTPHIGGGAAPAVGMICKPEQRLNTMNNSGSAASSLFKLNSLCSWTIQVLNSHGVDYSRS